MFAVSSAVCERVCSTVLILFRDGETSIILSASETCAARDSSGPVDQFRCDAVDVVGFECCSNAKQDER